MTTELYYLTLATLFTAVLWIPYLLNRMAVRGLGAVVGSAPQESDMQLSPWARRLRAAHINAVENLVVFASLVLVANVTSMSSSVTAGATIVYFWARVGHYVIYGLGIPVLRTAAYLISWGAQVVLAWQIIEAIR